MVEDADADVVVVVVDTVGGVVVDSGCVVDWVILIGILAACN